jgi:hypothetical protein
MAFGARSAPTKPRDEPVADNHKARLVGIVDLGMQPGYEYQGTPVAAHFQVQFTYEFPDSLMKDGRPHWMSEDMKNSDYFESKKKSSKMMRRVYALDPNGTKSNNGKDIKPLLGSPCMVSADFNDRGYLTVMEVTRASGNGEDVGELKNPIFMCTFDNPDIEVFRRLPDFKKDKIKAALDFPGSNLEKALLAEGLMGDNVDEKGPGY